MKSASTSKLFAYWNERRGSRLAPERGDIEPGAIRDVLGDSFIITFDPEMDHPFRLAGTRICALFGRELKNEPFVQLWDLESRKVLRDMTTVVADEAVATVAGVRARTEQGSTADLELLLLPLYHRGKTHVRLLGLLVPLETPYWVGGEHVATLTLGAMRHLSPAIETITAPHFGKRTAPGRVRGGLTIYEGGRDTN
jgi:hypothetical protein